jgi:hypothetical protein
LQATFEAGNSTDINFLDMPVILLEKASFSVMAIMKLAFGVQLWERTISIVSFAQRLILTFLFFFLLTVAEKTFKQRFVPRLLNENVIFNFIFVADFCMPNCFLI